MLESKCADLPFKLFGKLIPIFGSTLLSSAQNLNGGADGEGSRPQEDSPVADPPPDEVQEIMLFEASAAKPTVEETAEAKRSDCVKTVPKKPEKVLPCPRCDSADTKFCYYNNYNVNQPRHFCKNCQRYWTAGGTLRNVPVGAGRRKTKHSALDSIASSFSVPTPAASSVVISFGLDHCKDAVQALLGIPAVESNSRSVSGSHNKMGARDTAEAKSEKFPGNHDGSWWTDARGPWSDGSSDGSLGKHRRCSHRQPVPRTLSITDGKEVSESSIWKNVRVKSKREAPSTDDKPIWACPSNVLCGNSNPAAHWRSMFYQNSA